MTPNEMSSPLYLFNAMIGPVPGPGDSKGLAVQAAYQTPSYLATGRLLALKLAVVTKRHSFHCFDYELTYGRPWIE